MEINNSTLLVDKMQSTPRHSRLWDVLLILMLLLGAYFRIVGMNWDADQHLHPDERFMTMVESAIAPVNNLSEYFDTNTSSLNPNNRGYSFYVYGTLPLIIVRYAAEWTKQAGYDQVYLVGRYISAFADWLTIWVIFLAASRLYRDRRIGVLASAFYALAVLPIQLSHFFTVDSFLGLFGFLTFYFAVLVMTRESTGSSSPIMKEELDPPQEIDERMPETDAGAQVFEAPLEKTDAGISVWLGKQWGSLIPYGLFGAALGMAMASKISAAPLAILLPAAAYIFWSKLPKDQQDEWFVIILRNLVIGGLVALLVFRICQPYAFSGPGFLGLKLNPKWIDSLKELNAQSTGDVDFPPALQWARRPIYFAWQNMVEWGLGLPLGLLAWAGFLWMGWRMLKGAWKQHALLWTWTLLYFSWQEINFTRSMRYQILVYPTLAIIASWAILNLWERKGSKVQQAIRSTWMRLNWKKILAVVLGVGVLAGTGAWAFAFTRIYTRPMTRVAASEWIYQNVPGPINLPIQTKTGTVSQPLTFRAGYELDSGNTWVVAFKPNLNHTITSINFSHIIDALQNPALKTLSVQVKDNPQSPDSLTDGVITDAFLSDGSDPRGKSFDVPLSVPIQADANQEYYLVIGIGEPGPFSLSVSGPMWLNEVGSDGKTFQQTLPEPVDALRDAKNNYSLTFTPIADGTIREVNLNKVVDWEASSGPKTLVVSLSDQPPGGGDPLGQAELANAFLPGQDVRGQSYTVQLDRPVTVKQNTNYYLTIQKTQGPGEIAIYGTRTAIESSWDDPLPLPMEGFSPFDLNNGLYRTDLNFEMYWDDNQDKLDRFTSILNQADTIFITSNRQWGTTVRVPERYPLTAYYYRNLIGCPDTESIISCYADAKPGMFKGNLGFNLVAVFQSNPNLGPIQFNDQYAEEAFTVYDHPKVLVFQKQPGYDPIQVRSMLAGVDLSNVVHVTPRKAGTNPANLMLPADRLAQQQAGGTWSQLFDPLAIFNLQPGLALILWYLVISLLGWVVYPFVRLALRGLPDHGYPLTKLVGMLLLAYFSWLAGSAGIPVTKLLISIIAGLLLVGGGILAWIQRDSLKQEWQERKRYFLMVELVAVSFLAIDVLIRLGNPDLWHPSKGGEKPMDFDYFNAIIKSTTFPPFDPWFAGGYINYYYFGFVLVGIPVKWLGIVPSIAYNLILPTMFSFLAMGAFSFAWNIISSWRNPIYVDGEDEKKLFGVRQLPLLAGLAAAVAILILGNEGTVRMIWQGMMRLAAPGGNIDTSNLLLKLSWTVQGLGRLLTGARLPYGPGDWYWIPSRAIPGEPITEFPLFTFLYGDPHAHLFALPLTLLALSWAVSIVLGKWCWGDFLGRYKILHFAGSFFLGGLVIGSLRPTNTWDLPTYLTLGMVAIVYSVYRYGGGFPGILQWMPKVARRTVFAVASVILLVGLSFILYQPYANWYAQGYNSIRLWDGDHTPFWSYTTHWGLFLFVIFSWLAWETREWMASTPVSSLRKLKPYELLIEGVSVLLLAAVLVLTVLKVQIAWLALPLAAWAAVLMLRPGQPDSKRFVLFMVGSGLVLTLAVELVVLVGDIGRMNTVFKFYLQAWTLLSLSAAMAFMWLLPSVIRVWNSGWRNFWTTAVMLLVFGAFLFPLMGGMDKITDRMSKAAPHTLDGMAYMAYSTYSEHDMDMQLVQDYAAIKWMQENVQGSPVIAEADLLDLYRWSNRFSIYTGLPDVAGWDWHERQQRSVVPGEWVTNRVNEIAAFYLTVDPAQTEDFIHKYNVRYIIVGQLEKAVYNGAGLTKFPQWDGKYWKQVYQQGDTSIYEVIQ